MKTICIPGIPVKHNNPCIDPLQSPISHVIETFETVDGEVVHKGFAPNTLDYPEYEYVIQMFIDSKMGNLSKHKGI